MELNEYQEKAAKAAFYEKNDLVYLALGIAGEGGEVADHMKKVMRDDYGRITDERREILIKELGDVLWYVSKMAGELNVSLDDVAVINLVKIKDRVARGVQHGSGDNR